PAICASLASRTATALAANGFVRREQLFEGAQLLWCSDSDHHVAHVEDRVRRRSRVERAVLLAETDDHRARVLADAEIADRAPGLVGIPHHLDLLELELRPTGSGDHVQKRRHLWTQYELRHLPTRGGVRLDDAVGAREPNLLRR